MSARYEVRGDMAVITLDDPPANGLRWAVRKGLMEGLARAEADKRVRALVLHGAGRGFSGGADLREFDTPGGMQEPRLASVVRAIERAAKPVVAALHGVCAGGGLELALACHARVAVPGATLSLPEARLGLLPMAGATQRLPRAIGVEPALQMILSGEPQTAEALAELPGQRLIDRLVEGDGVAGALALAAELAQQGALPRLRDLPCTHPQGAAFFRFARHTVRRTRAHLPAPLLAVDCVAAAVLQPFDAGLALEAESFATLLRTPESRALRHVFFAERAAGRIPDVAPHTPARPLYKAAVVGAGTMGAAIATSLLGAGLSVLLLDLRAEALEQGLAAVRAHFESEVAAGRLRESSASQRLGLLHGTLDESELRDADLVIEALPEDLALKEELFRRLGETVRQGAVLASGTAPLDLERVAVASRRAQDVVGLHFFSPAPDNRLLEVVRGARTAPDVLATAMRLAARLRRQPVLVRAGGGSIARRLRTPLLRQACRLVEEGCTPEQVDRAAEQFGFAAGPFTMPPPRSSEDGPTPVSRSGLAPRRIEDAEIVERLVGALIDEAARILEDGIALRASDIDLACIAGLGFPLWRGGPLCHADAVGLFDVVQGLRHHGRHAGAPAREPAPLLVRLAEEGRCFHRAS